MRHCATSLGGILPGMLLVLVLALALPAPGALAAAQPPASTVEREGRVYIPIDRPAIEPAPVARPAAPKEPKTTAARATQAIASGIEIAPKVPFAQLPGTAIPLWWLVVVLLAVPAARVWRGWTARMFE